MSKRIYKTLSQEEFLQRARAKHGEKYDYSNTVFVATREPIEYICPTHGIVKQLANSHLQGMGCRACANDEQAANKVRTLDWFVKKARKVHGDKYDYSDAKYTGAARPITYRCPKHGLVTQRAYSHLEGSGCNDCFIEGLPDARRISKEEFLKKVHDKHGDMISFGNFKYQGVKAKLTAICAVHGPFETTGVKLLAVSKVVAGCPKCGHEANTSHHPMTFKEFVTRAEEVHGNKYIYDESSFSSCYSNVGIFCKQHKYNFSQAAYAHLRGQGCVKCAAAVSVSAAEKDISAWLTSKNIRHEQSRRDLVPERKLEADLLLNDYALILEHNGLIYHSEWKLLEHKYHQRKSDAFAKLGYSTVHIWSDEWAKKPDIIKNLIGAKTGQAMDPVHARKCHIVNLTAKQARAFLEATHLQGFAAGTYLGLKDATGLQAVAVFGHTKAGEPELTRYSTRLGARVRGGMSRLIKAWQKVSAESSLVTFCDLSKYSGASYTAVGFKKEKELAPDYWYTNGTDRKVKSGFRRARMAEMWKDFDPEKSERKNAFEHGWYRIWDCGKIKFRLIF